MSAAAYWSFFRVRFVAGLQYRAAALAGIATQFAWGILEICMYLAFYKSNPDGFPMGLGALFSYIWLQQALLSMFMPWIFDNSIFSGIKSGAVALELCRPADIYTMWYVRNCAMRLSRAIMRCIPVFVITSLLPKPYGITPPASGAHFGLFLISLILGFGVVVAFGMLIYISAFYLVDERGVRLVTVTVAEFFSGGVIPLPFLPDAARWLIDLLPFASMQSTPFLIWGGTMSADDAIRAVGLQLFWLLALISIGRIWMKAALKRVTIQGG